MFKFSTRSLKNLNTCHQDLIKLMHKALKTSPIDYSIICGHRGKDDQDEAVEKGYSKARYPDSKHNTYPSIAVDIQPYPYTKLDMRDRKHIKFRLLSEHIRKVANELKIPHINGGLDWGWDWYHWQLVL